MALKGNIRHNQSWADPIAYQHDRVLRVCGGESWQLSLNLFSTKCKWCKWRLSSFGEIVDLPVARLREPADRQADNPGDLSRSCTVQLAQGFQRASKLIYQMPWTNYAIRRIVGRKLMSLPFWAPLNDILCSLRFSHRRLAWGCIPQERTTFSFYLVNFSNCPTLLDQRNKDCGNKSGAAPS